MEARVLYPVFLDLNGKRGVVVGGGNVAARKAAGLHRAGGVVVAVAPEVTPELSQLADEVVLRPYRAGDLEGAAIAFAATSERVVNAAVAREAKELGILVNVADEPGEGDFIVPSVLRRGAMQVAVSTGGASPALARAIRQELEGIFGPEWADLIQELDAARRGGQKLDGELEGVVRSCLSQLRG